LQHHYIFPERRRAMKVKDLLCTAVIEDNDIIIIIKNERFLTKGNWYQDNILKYSEATVKYYFCAIDYMNLNGKGHRHIIVLEEI
jgi:hypothetical protein